MTPVILAKQLKLDPKRLRAWLRKTYPRPRSEHGKRWHLTDKQKAEARRHFRG